MKSNILDTINYFFFEHFDKDCFKDDFPSIHKKLKERQFDDFFLEIVRVLKNNKTKIVAENNLQLYIQEFEKSIHENLSESSSLFDRYSDFKGLDTLPYSYFPELKEVAINILEVLKALPIKSKTTLKTKQPKPETFEVYLTAYDIDKIQPLLARFIRETVENLAALSFALDLENFRPRKKLCEAINKYFQTEYSRQTIEYQFKQYENTHDIKRQNQIKAIKKEIQTLIKN